MEREKGLSSRLRRELPNRKKTERNKFQSGKGVKEWIYDLVLEDLLSFTKNRKTETTDHVTDRVS